MVCAKRGDEKNRPATIKNKATLRFEKLGVFLPDLIRSLIKLRKRPRGDNLLFENLFFITIASFSRSPFLTPAKHWGYSSTPAANSFSPNCCLLLLHISTPHGTIWLDSYN